MSSTTTLFTVSTVILKNSTITDDSIQHDEERKVPKAVVLVFLMTLSLVVNISVSLVALRDRHLRVSIGNKVLTSISFSNLLMIALMLFCALSLLGVITNLPKQVCIVLTRLHSILVYVSILHLFVLSIDKYVAIFYPLRYAQNFTVTRLIIGLCLAWIVPTFTIGVVPEIKADEDYQSSITTVDCLSVPAYSTRKRQRNYVFFNAVFLFGIPLFCMLVTYFKIARVSSYQSNRVDHEPRDVATRARSARTRARETKWAKTIGIMITGFIVCNLPIIVMLVQRASRGLESTTSVNAILFLSFANTLINPLIYCLRNRDYRKAILNLCVKHPNVMSGCMKSQTRRRASKVAKSEQKQNRRGQGTEKADNISELSSASASTSFSLVVSRATFQSILCEVLEDGETARSDIKSGRCEAHFRFSSVPH